VSRDGVPDTSVIFYISGDGNYYTMDEGALRCEGRIKWYMDSGWQLLYFYDDAKVNDRLYVVMPGYTSDSLILHLDGSGVDWKFDVVRY
jgi:hypothetical protein